MDRRPNPGRAGIAVSRAAEDDGQPVGDGRGRQPGRRRGAGRDQQQRPVAEPGGQAGPLLPGRQQDPRRAEATSRASPVGASGAADAASTSTTSPGAEQRSGLGVGDPHRGGHESRRRARERRQGPPAGRR